MTPDPGHCWEGAQEWWEDNNFDEKMNTLGDSPTFNGGRGIGRVKLVT